MSTTDTALRDDIRLLGRLLGDVLRHYEGDAMFERIEQIRQTSTRFGRHGDPADGRQLDRLLKKLDRDATVSVVRAFSYFSHLANLAEDQQQVRALRRARLAAEPLRGSLAQTVELLGTRGVTAARTRALLHDACLMPVLTAHPTEVQRKSILDTERAIAHLLDDSAGAEPAAEERSERLGALIATLWQTRMLRPEKLTVADEIGNALSYWQATFLTQVPALYGDLARRLGADTPAAPAPGRPFLRLGSWIGGDRDGHPHVGAQTMRAALGAQAGAVLNHYLHEVHLLGSELSISALLRPAGAALQRLAAASPDPSPHRLDEPYRRALTGVYARLHATAQSLGLGLQLRPPLGAAPPYSGGAEFEADWPATACTRCSARCGPSASTAPPSTCARTPTCSRRWWRSCWPPPKSVPTTAGCRRPSASSCWCANWRMRGRCCRRTCPTPSAPARSWRCSMPPASCARASAPPPSTSTSSRTPRP